MNEEKTDVIDSAVLVFESNDHWAQDIATDLEVIIQLVVSSTELLDDKGVNKAFSVRGT